MATHYHSRKNVDFLLYDVHNAEELTKLPHFADHDKETFDMTIDTATQIADTLMHPYLTDIDRNETQLKDGKVTVHPKIKEFLKAMGESGLIGADFNYEHGGAQMPATVTGMCGYILMAANNGMMYTGLTAGAARLIAAFASEEMKEAYVPKMLSGEWQGTMCLTEPQAGSSLSDIVATATPNEDGTYNLTGQKIFISGGDSDAVDNVIHRVIARIKGAPLGPKGISLFVVPKIKLDGSDNKVENLGIYHKIGQRGVPAMHHGFEESTAYIVGEPNRGLKYMFQMMNEARIGVGLAGAGISSAAYYAALEYAKERPQSRRLNQKHALDSPQIPIIQHPDVKRMLLSQKAAVEGGLSLLTETSILFDKVHATEDAEEKEKYRLLLELLTPVAKTYPCESGMQVTSDGVQIFGGYGFTQDFPAEQFYRDIRITPIYEGTTGIQSQDLLGRKVPMADGKALMLLLEEVTDTIKAAMEHEELKKYAGMLTKEMERLQKVTMHLLSIAARGDAERYLSDATLYMELFSINIVAWQWLKQAVVSKQKMLITSGDSDDMTFYESKVHTMKYFFHYETPKTAGLITRLMDEEVLTIEMDKQLIM
ncbi:MAG: acyl-CoA dehydrogenase [Spirosomataceae bacterium]